MSDKVVKKPDVPEEYVLFYTYLQNMLLEQGTDAYNEYMENGHKQLIDEIESGLFWEACLKLGCEEYLN